MRATLYDNQFIYLSNITQAEEDIIADRFTVQMPNSYIDPNQRTWDGVYCRYHSRQQRLARPFLAALRGVCRRYGLPLVIDDQRPPWGVPVADPDTIGPDWLPGITLEDYQVRAIRACCRAEVGIVSIPTGGGKSEVLAGICKAMPCLTAIFADQLVIIDQLKARLELRDVVKEVGLFYAGKTPTDQLIIIGSIQSVTTPSKLPSPPERSDYDSDAKYDKATQKYQGTMRGLNSRCKRARLFQELVKRAELLMVDEVDLAVSKSYRSLFRFWCRARRRFGFSGTPYDASKLVQNLFLQEHLGSVIYKVSRQEVFDAGRISDVTYDMLVVGPDQKYEASALDVAYDDHLVRNPAFHQTIARVCRGLPDVGVFILVERIELGNALQALIPGSQFIHGQTRKRRRDEVLSAFERRELKVIIGGKIVKRGLDLKGGCEVLILATGGKQSSNLKQQVGRGERLNKLGLCRVIDFYFLGNRYLYDHSRARLRTMVDHDYKTRVILTNGSTIDGAKLIAARWRLPKQH